MEPAPPPPPPVAPAPVPTRTDPPASSSGPAAPVVVSNNVNGNGQGEGDVVVNCTERKIVFKALSSSGPEERLPKWQLDLLMEKLRQKASSLKPLVETSKSIRQSLMERRLIIDQTEEATLQKSLDALQQSISVNSLQSMVEKLEMVARQLGLKFTPGATGHEWFVSSDMFYLELLIDSRGVVEDVKIEHEGKTERQSCPEIVESLRRIDFIDFTAHLHGLVSIYQLNADKKIKSKAYIALQCLEADLALMASSYSQINDAETGVMKTLLGILQPRKGGHPVKLTYFISPYEFLDTSQKTSINNDVSAVIKNKLGTIATVNIQASSSHKLQMSPIVTLSQTPDGKRIPRYGTLNATNSTVLPACFSLSLTKPVPICLELLKAISNTTDIDAFDVIDSQPILNLVTHQLSNGTLNCSEKGLFVALPDQVHCYFMTESWHLEGVMVSSIPFTLASQLPQIFAILRQQMAFNTLVGSCVRIGSKPELDHIVFEVTALSHQKLAVSFQHPLDDSLVTLEFDLRDVTHPHCHLHAVANASDIIPTLEEHACKVVKRSMSIPVTLRAVIRRWQSMKVKVEPPNPDFGVAVGGSGMNLDLRLGPDRSCGAESGERRSSTSHPNVLVPPGVMNFSSANGASMKPSIPASPSYSISPVNFSNQSMQNPMDIFSYMNMNQFLNNQVNLGGGTSPFPSINPNLAMQMLASHMQTPGTPSQMLMGLLDHVGQPPKPRKRKSTSDSLTSPTSKSNPQMMRPGQRSAQRSPMRRQSDSSDGSGTDKHVMNMLMNELGMEHLPDSRWNIDITPVNPSMEGSDELDGFKKQGHKKSGPKRSLSLDSHSSEDISSIQSLMDSPEFKPLMTPSLSITPVSTTSSTVNSLLASIRPGIEIIPLPTPLTIPTSLTVTPIKPGTNSEKQQVDKDKKAKDRNIMGKRKFEGGEMGGRPPKIPFLDSKGRLSPSINLIKKPTSQGMNLNLSPSKTLATSQGKPSVSTLKSVSSPKSTEGNPMKPKMKKPTPKAVRNFMGMGTIPPLKAISPEMINAVNKLESLQRLESSSSKDKLLSNVASALQQASACIVANSQKATPVKKGGLTAVIDRLKSVHSSTEMPPGAAGDKKESTTTMSAKDYLKVSSAITNDVLQQKKALTAGSVGISPSGQEYMVKGGQGLKLTLNKAKFNKDPTKSPKTVLPGLKSPITGVKKLIPGMKPLSALSAKLASMTKKSLPLNKDAKDMGKLGGIAAAKIKDSKPRLESEDLTKKLFLPGSLKSLEGGLFPTAPIFDTKFQIPKKAKASSNGSTSATSDREGSTGSKNGNNSDKDAAASTAKSITPPPETSSPSKEKLPVTTNPSSSIPPSAEVLTVPSSKESQFEGVAKVRPERSEPPPLIEVSSFQLNMGSQEKAEPDSTTVQSESEPQTSEESKPADTPMSPCNDNEDVNTPTPLATEFTSPASPDPVTNTGLTPTAPQTIPTVPINSGTTTEESSQEDPVQPESNVNTCTTPPPVTTSPVTVSETQPQETPEEVEEGALFIDDCMQQEIEKPTAAESSSSSPQDTAVKPPEEDEKEVVMPPPPPPPVVTGVLDLSSSSGSATSHAQPTPSPPQLPPSPKPVTSPFSQTVSIASVHIVHSPQPNSPALLRSPLVQPSPVASPYPIDDDLMDAALIGDGSNK